MPGMPPMRAIIFWNWPIFFSVCSIWSNGGLQNRACQATDVRYNERMKTLTITEGRGRLGYWLKKATEGEDIGFVFGDKIVALRPVEVVSTDYALQEYGLTAKEMEVAERRIHAQLKTARARRELTLFTGKPKSVGRDSVES
jgi:hypothetical protein